MTSKRLFVNLLKENSKRRLWPIALSITGNFFAQIVFAVLKFGSYRERLQSQLTNMSDVRADFYREVAGMHNDLVLLIVIGLAFLVALQGYFYLFDSRQTDLYYSLPVRRQNVFDAFNLVGILTFVIPYIICHIITVIMGLSRGYVQARTLPLIVGSAIIVILEYILFYEVCVLAAVLTGHVVVAALGCVVFFAYGPIAVYLKELLMHTFFTSYYSGVYRKDVLKFSPYFLANDMVKLLGGTDRNAIAFNMGAAWGKVLLAVVVAALCYIVSRILVDRRAAEAAGKAMAFEITKPVIKIIMMVSAGIGSGITMFYISRDRSLGVFVFGMICGIVVAHFVIETIYEFDFKASFGHFGSMAAGAVITVLIFLVCVFDIFGYESWQPMPGKVESVAFADDLGYHYMTAPYYRTETVDDDDRYYFYTIDSEDFALNNMKLTDIESVEKLTRQGAINAVKSHKMALRDEEGFYEGYSIYSNGDDIEDRSKPYYSTSFKVRWKMKSGREITRQYEVDLTDDELLEAYKNIFNNEEYKIGKLPILTMDPSEVSKLRCETLGGDFSEKIDEDMTSGLIDAYKEDVLKQTFEDAVGEIPNIEIALCGEYRHMVDAENEFYNFFVYPSFKKTSEYLAKRDIPTNWRDGEEKVAKITCGVQIWEEDEEYSHEEYWTSQDKDEIKSVLENTIPQDIFYSVRSLNSTMQELEWNGDYCRDVTLSFDVGADKETRSIGTILFCDDKLPQNVKDVCFPHIDDEENSSAVRSGNVGWMKCVSNG